METLSNEQGIGEFIKEVELLLATQENVVIALSGGRSVQKFFELLAGVLEEKKADWADKLKFVQLDERIVPVSSEQSNYHQNQMILDTQAKGYEFVPVPTDSERPAKKYTEMVGQIDLIVAGAGKDGHIGSLFPNHELLEIDQTVFVEISDSPRPPARRISASPGLIRSAKVAFLFFLTEEKRRAWEDFKNPAVSWQQCPVKIANDVSKLYIISDLEG
ncbi:MAG: 6-phosphogluconolactonase [Candidatus Dojkabacteria bacterium]